MIMAWPAPATKRDENVADALVPLASRVGDVMVDGSHFVLEEILNIHGVARSAGGICKPTKPTRKQPLW